MHSGAKETIAPLGNGLYISRTFGIVAKRLSQLAHRDAEAAVKVDERPLPARYGFSAPRGYDLSGALQKHDQKPKRLLLQLYAPAVLQQFAGGGVYLKRTEEVHNSGMCLHILPPKAIEG